MTAKRRSFFTSSPMGAISATIVAAYILLAIVAPIFWGELAQEPTPTAMNQPPSGEHWLGTDGLGRDLFFRSLVATRISLVMALIATAIGAAGGLLLGALPVVLGPRAQRWFGAVINTWL